jgi:hypothetical protein
MFAVAEKPIGVREIKAVDALWKLSSLRGVIASDLRPSLADLRDIFLRLATALRKHVDIMDFSRVVPLLTLRYI